MNKKLLYGLLIAAVFICGGVAIYGFVAFQNCWFPFAGACVAPEQPGDQTGPEDQQKPEDGATPIPGADSSAGVPQTEYEKILEAKPKDPDAWLKTQRFTSSANAGPSLIGEVNSCDPGTYEGWAQQEYESTMTSGQAAYDLVIEGDQIYLLWSKDAFMIDDQSYVNSLVYVHGPARFAVQTLGTVYYMGGSDIWEFYQKYYSNVLKCRGLDLQLVEGPVDKELAGYVAPADPELDTPIPTVTYDEWVKTNGIKFEGTCDPNQYLPYWVESVPSDQSGGLPQKFTPENPLVIPAGQWGLFYGGPDSIILNGEKDNYLILPAGTYTDFEWNGAYRIGTDSWIDAHGHPNIAYYYRDVLKCSYPADDFTPTFVEAPAAAVVPSPTVVPPTVTATPTN